MRLAEGLTTEGSTNIYGNLTLDPSSVNSSYFYTIKHTRRYPTIEDYERIIKRWRKLHFYVDCVTYELDSIGKLHVHGIATARANYYTKRLALRCFSYRVYEIKSDKEFKQSYNYCYKQVQNSHPYLQDEFLSDYYIRHHPYPYISE